MSALSVGSFVQNVVFYLLLWFLVYANYCLIASGSDKQRGTSRRPREMREEKALEERIASLENALERVSDAVYMVDRDWNFIYINKAYERLQRRDRTQLLGKNVWEMFPYGKELRYFKEYDYALRQQVSVHFEEFNDFNGMWVSASAYPVKSGLAIYFRDITEDKLMREKVG